MDPLLTANNYFVQITSSYSNPIYNTSLLTSNPSVSDYCPTIDFIKGEIPDVYGDVTSSSNSSNSSSSSPPEPAEPIKTDLRKVRRKGKVSGTNLYGRPYCPGRPLSMAERTRIIELHMSGMKVNAISKSLCISHGCVSKIISRYRSTGILTPASSPEQRRSRRIKKTENSPETTAIQEHYGHLEYPMPTLAFLPSPPTELLQSSPNHPYIVQSSYTTVHDHMVIHDYPSSIVL